MKKSWIITGITIVASLALTAGIAFAAGRGSSSPTRTAAAGYMGTDQMMAAHSAMHDSPAMQAMHDRMPAAQRERCEALHEQMDQMMGSMTSGSMTGGMDGMGGMGGSDMMAGAAAPSSASMVDHHQPIGG